MCCLTKKSKIVLLSKIDTDNRGNVFCVDLVASQLQIKHQSRIQLIENDNVTFLHVNKSNKTPENPQFI